LDPTLAFFADPLTVVVEALIYAAPLVFSCLNPVELLRYLLKFEFEFGSLLDFNLSSLLNLFALF
jgi:hypothetical protein